MATRILIAEDDRALAHALQLKLTHEGFEVVMASNGAECLSLLKENTYGMLLLDLMMPEFDGFQVLDSLKQSHAAMPVIVLSNLSQREDEDRAMALGAKRYFVKSNTPLAEIVTAIKELL